MSHLLTEYSKNLEVKPSNVIVNKHFFPVVPKDYIVIYNEQDIDAKCYNYYGLFCDLIKQELDKFNIKILIIGSEKNATDRFDYLYPNLSFRHNAYIVSKAKALISVDNAITQYASSQGVPVVSLYGNIYPSITTPYWSKPHQKIDLKPDWDKKPCMSTFDPDGSIDRIKAEEVSESLLLILSSNYKKYKGKLITKPNFKTKLINKKKSYCIDVIPTQYVNLPIFENNILNIRLDKDLGNMASLQNYCNNHECVLFLKDSLLQIDSINSFSKNIKSINVITTVKPQSIPKKYFSILKSLGIDFCFLVSNKDILDDMRFEYFDSEVQYYNPPKDKPKNIDTDNKFLSFKLVVEGEKIYQSTYHWKKNLDSEDNIVDNPDYWEELDYFYIYEQKRGQKQSS